MLWQSLRPKLMQTHGMDIMDIRDTDIIDIPTLMDIMDTPITIMVIIWAKDQLILSLNLSLTVKWISNLAIMDIGK